MLTGTLSASGGTPTGIIQFFDGTSPIGSGVMGSGPVIVSVSTLAIGTHAITATYGGNSLFAPQTSQTVSVTIEGFSLSILNPNVDIHHGGTATFSLIISSLGTTGMVPDISMSVTGGPPHGTSTFSPASVVVGSGTTPVQLVMQTPNYPDGSPFVYLKTTSSQYTVTFCGFCVVLFSLTRKRKFSRRLLALCLSFSALLVLSGCGAGWGTQTFDLTITAKSGQTTRTATATIKTNCANGQTFCRW